MYSRGQETAKKGIEGLVWLVCYRRISTGIIHQIPVQISNEDHDVDDGNQKMENVIDQDVAHDTELNNVESGIGQLSNVKLIDSELEDKLRSLHAASYKKTSDSGLPVHEVANDSDVGRKKGKPSIPLSLRSFTKKKSLSTNQQLCGYYNKESGLLWIVSLE